ncbi:TetR family transcriptional regulator [Actinobacteria bacterium YIM 96077]|uniref:TetR family transcriptional regulator n=1 Tax=Phytoactinopolyspora halophila TaxID=1981511 RepID=A0A329QST0_9ACTN|nr:TetR family transcriptional regulator [Phytoactinopolyspora halophila]AYY14977.1 TetR family transcriptional regulator [Actinobacteria bacterium YIM 96077]RAW15434.1 TetR family transcriptional regulator [Phytoactinopolyspora halophila]
MQDATSTDPPSATRDGRRARGERRRAEIIAATLRVVERDGAAGVTHRSVAREAEVPTSLTTYYFATLDELLVAALTAVADDYERQLREIVDSAGNALDGLAELIVSAANEGHRRAVAERELVTLAARRPAMRDVANYWRRAVAEIARQYTDDPVAVETAVAAADGLCTRILLDGQSLSRRDVRAVLERALGVSLPG